MNLLVSSFSAFPGTHGDRAYMELNVSMTRDQMQRAVVEMLGRMTESEAAALLRREFPELFAEVE